MNLDGMIHYYISRQAVIHSGNSTELTTFSTTIMNNSTFEYNNNRYFFEVSINNMNMVEIKRDNGECWWTISYHEPYFEQLEQYDPKTTFGLSSWGGNQDISAWLIEKQFVEPVFIGQASDVEYRNSDFVDFLVRFTDKAQPFIRKNE